jgi:virulence factor Mce-like protein
MAAVAFSMYLFRGGGLQTVPITVVSPRAGLVMDPGAKVKLKGVDVGRVSSIRAMPNGQALLHLAINSSRLQLIPSNVMVDIASSTVFGAKAVRLVLPADPSPISIRPGQVLEADHVVVEVDTLFEKLTSTLSKIEPAKLNEILGAVASALGDRGEKFGQSLADLDEMLTRLDPSLPHLGHEITASAAVAKAYADSAPDLLAAVANTNQIADTVVDEQSDLDAVLISAIVLSDVGDDVLGTTGKALINLLHLLVPTTNLTNRYHEALTCGLQAVVPFTKNPPTPEPGIMATTGTVLGLERYRYPSNLPKVAAKGGPQCQSQKLPNMPLGFSPPYVVADIGANPAQYSNPGILLNFDGLKQLLFGPIDGPPRNSAQIGMPG